MVSFCLFVFLLNRPIISRNVLTENLGLSTMNKMLLYHKYKIYQPKNQNQYPRLFNVLHLSDEFI